MTTPDHDPLGAASEADVAEQHVPIDDTEDNSWSDAQRSSETVP